MICHHEPGYVAGSVILRIRPPRSASFWEVVAMENSGLEVSSVSVPIVLGILYLWHGSSLLEPGYYSATVIKNRKRRGSGLLRALCMVWYRYGRYRIY